MPADRAAIDAELARLEAAIPTMIETSVDPVEAVAGQVETLAEGNPSEARYIHSRVQAMLCAAGLVPGEECEPEA